MKEIVIVGAARTPTGRLLGALSTVPATELGSVAIAAALKRSGVEARDVDAVYLGQVLQAGAGQNPAKQAALGAGIEQRAHTVTINKVCLSGLTAVIDAARLLRAGEAEVVVAGGMESMSRAPHLADIRGGVKYGDAGLVDHMAYDGLSSAEHGNSMGQLTEDYAATYPVTRQEQDAVAAASHQRAAAAQAEGRFAAEMAPVTVSSRRGEVVVDTDEGVRPDSSVEKLAQLKPAFAADGSVTAANSSQISDGASAVVLTTRENAENRGLPVLAVLGAVGQVAGPDASLQQKPADAIQQALDRAGWTADQLDLVEINEAFAAVSVHSARVLGVDQEKVNVDGGAVALGHPIGSSGSRLVAHAAHLLAAGIGKRAAVGLCGGGGQGEALLLSADGEA